MKKILLIICIAFLFTSCYQSRVTVGNPYVPKVKVMSRWNSSILGGLIPISTNMQTNNYLVGIKNYEIKTRRTFWNIIVQSLTCGIYSPTTTTIYVGIGENTNTNNDTNVNNTNK